MEANVEGPTGSKDMRDSVEEDARPAHRVPGSTVHSSRNSSRRASRSNSPTKRKTGLDGLLAIFGDEYELYEAGNDGQLRKLEAVPDQKTIRAHKRNFILRRKTTHQRAHEAVTLAGNQGANLSFDRYDYDAKYPMDEPREEKEAGARIWRIYMDEAGQFDSDMVENMRDTVDVILIFAGLFSAIVTTLVALTATALQLDQPKVTNLLLMELIAIQRASIAGLSINQIIPSPLTAESPSNSTAETTDYWINGLWFTSLAFSLSTALIAVLVKQWIQAYVAPTFTGSPRAQAEVRHFRYRGIEAWHVPLIIGLLPTLLHLSLFLFFIGLAVFLSTLDITITIVVVVITSLACIAYVVANMLPAVYAGCPYQTPLSSYAFLVLHSLKTAYTSFWARTSTSFFPTWRRFITALYLPLGAVIRGPWFLLVPSDSADTTLWDFILGPIKSVNYLIYFPHQRQDKPRTLKELEAKEIEGEGEELHSQMFTWLLQTSAASPSVKSAVLAVWSLEPDEFAHLRPPLTSWEQWNRLIQRSLLSKVTDLWISPVREVWAPVMARISPERDPPRMDAVIDVLQAAKNYVHENLLTSPGLMFLREEELDVSSSTFWGDFKEFSAGAVFQRRFCLHVLHRTTPVLPSGESSLNIPDLSILFPALSPSAYPSYYLWTPSVYPTDEALRTLHQWIPTPSWADALDLSTSIAELETLLNVAAFLLTGWTEFCGTFTENDSLGLWRRVYDHFEGRIPPDLANALDRMMSGYVLRDAWMPEYHDYALEQIDVICLWHVVCPADELVGYIRRLISERPDHPGWQNLYESLPVLLLTAPEEVQQSGKALLERIDDALEQQRGYGFDMVQSTPASGTQELLPAAPHELGERSEGGSVNPIASYDHPPTVVAGAIQPIPPSRQPA